MLVRHRQIDDGEHHENEGLQRNHQDVKDGPDEAQHQLGDNAEPAADTRELTHAMQREEGKQQEDHFAGEQVAEQSQRQRDGARDERHDLEQQVGGNQQHLHDGIAAAEGLHGEFTDESAEPFHFDAVVDDQHEHGERQRERDVHVCARHDLQMLHANQAPKLGQQVYRQQVHEVEEEYPGENGERERRDELRGAAEALFHGVVYEVHQKLHER